MTSNRWLQPWLVSLVLAGCSQASLDHPSGVLDPGPHRGALRPIEGAEGFIEVLSEPVRDAPAGSPKFRVVVYFLDKSQTAPLKPIPDEVNLATTWRNASTPQAIHLTMDPVPGDPAGAAKFVATPADHKGEPSGTLKAKLGDRAITAVL